MKRLLLLTLLIGLPSYAGDISASYSNSSFEEIFKVDTLQSIEMWEQPKTKYTPKNLVSEQQMRFNGKQGTRTYNSYTFHVTDYDTKIVKSFMKDGKFYVQDNLGNIFQTGIEANIDTSQIENNIQRVDKQVQTNTSNINAIRNDVSHLNNRVDNIQQQINRLDNRLERGLATVTALTALHPNPRHQGKTQISVGTGMYADNVAGAIGVFHYLNDRVMLSGGASYGGGDSWAGNLGITIGF